MLGELHAKVLPFIMRREKAEVLRDLPPKIIQDIECDMTPAQTRIYEHFENIDNKIFKDLIEKRHLGDTTETEPSTEPKNKASKNFFSLLTKLRKSLNAPSLVVDSINAAELEHTLKIDKKQVTGYLNSGKFEALLDLLLQLGFSQEDRTANAQCRNRVLIFTRCNQTLAILETFLRDNFRQLQFCGLKPD